MSAGPSVFDPTQPVLVNGYRYEPAQRACAAIEDDEMGGSADG